MAPSLLSGGSLRITLRIIFSTRSLQKIALRIIIGTRDDDL